MNTTKTHGAVFLSLLLISGWSVGCSPGASFDTIAVSDSAATASSQSSVHCAAPPGVSGRPATIEDVVVLVNSLPKPVTIRCFLESLERPLNVALTNSQMSGQPAAGNRSPRIFVLNEKLYMSVVPEGRGRDYLELSYQTSTTTSIKAEIEFPVIQPIAKSKPYSNVRFGSGTNCSSCHRAEKQVGIHEGVPVFESWAYQPDKETLVDLQQFKNELKVCNFDKEPERCGIIKAVLSNGEVRTQAFPQSMYFNFSVW
nr:hypothetical protein HAGR004_13070 [Bdellovibrio sp. HAGR004]